MSDPEAFAALQRRVDELEASLARLYAEVARLTPLAERGADLDRIADVERWTAAGPVPDVGFSVITATRNRVGYLPHALASLERQSHPSWELIVVDDGSTDATPEYLAGLRDPRITVLRTEGIGMAAARNLALQHTSRPWVAYLDDDNTMLEHWLRSVAWGIAGHPDAELFYGAVLRERSPDSPAEPRTYLHPFDRETLLDLMPSDVGAMVHRAGLAEAYFDTDLDAFTDWDLLIRLTRDRDPVSLPVVALAYAVGAPGRSLGRGRDARWRADLRARHQGSGPAAS